MLTNDGTQGWIRVSVCMATYNGAPFLREQIDSILTQLEPADELIICDDTSDDGTWQIVSGWRDARVRVFRNPTRLGHVQNFVGAIGRARGRFVALSDQDDVWVKGRLQRMVEKLEELPPASLVIGDFVEVDPVGVICETRLNRLKLGDSAVNPYRQLARIFSGRVKYFGCAFVFERALLPHIIPMPRGIEAHDVWIAMKASLHGRILHMRENTLWHRVHGGNLTPKQRRAVWPIIKSRAIYGYYLVRDCLRA